MAHKGVRISHEELLTIAKGATVTYRPEAPTASLRGVNKDMLKTINAIANASAVETMSKANGKKRSKKVRKTTRKREGSFVFTTRQVKMTT